MVDVQADSSCEYLYCQETETVGHLLYYGREHRMCAEHMKPEAHPQDLHKKLAMDNHR